MACVELLCVLCGFPLRPLRLRLWRRCKRQNLYRKVRKGDRKGRKEILRHLTSFLNTPPSFITNVTSPSTLMSRSGSPLTATMSA